MNLHEFLARQGISPDKGLFLVYGKAGVGKTTFLMELASSCTGKAFIIDTEHGFSIDRFKQITKDTIPLDNLLVVRPKDYENQGETINRTSDNEQLFSFIGLDTIGKHYREASKKSRTEANNELARQMRILKEIARTKLVVVCNQVYQDITRNITEPLGKNYVTKWCDHVIYLDEQQEQRTIRINDHETPFTLTETGFLF